MIKSGKHYSYGENWIPERFKDQTKDRGAVHDFADLPQLFFSARRP